MALRREHRYRYAAAAIGAVLLAVFWWDMFLTVALMVTGGLFIWGLVLSDMLHPKDMPAPEPEDTEPSPRSPGEAGPLACRDCGWCCLSFYLPQAEGGVMPDSETIQERLAFHEPYRDLYGAEPAYDAALVHGDGRDDDYVIEMGDAGVDLYACEYLGEAGCMVPREFRPAPCLDFSCDRLDRTLRGEPAEEPAGEPEPPDRPEPRGTAGSDAAGETPSWADSSMLISRCGKDEALMAVARGISIASGGGPVAIVVRDGEVVSTSGTEAAEHPLTRALGLALVSSGPVRGLGVYYYGPEPCCGECVREARGMGIRTLWLLNSED